MKHAIEKQILNDEQINQLKLKKPLSVRELLILQRIQLIAITLLDRKALEIQKLKGKLETAESDREITRLEGEKSMLQLQIGMVTMMMRQFGRFWFTPISEMPMLLEANNAPLAPAGAGPEPKGESPVVHQADQAPESPAQRGWGQNLIDACPDWVGVAISPIRTAMTRLTPATSAVILAIVLIGAWKYAEWRHSALDRTLGAVVTERDELEKQNAKLQAQLVDFKETQNELKNAGILLNEKTQQIERADEKIDELEQALGDERANSQSRLDTLAESNKAELDTLRENLDVETRKQIATLESAMESMRAEISTKANENARLSERVKRIQPLEEQVQELQATLSRTNDLNQELEDQRSRDIAELTNLRLAVRALTAFADSLATASYDLYRSRSRDFDENRDEFKKLFEVIYNANRSTFEEQQIDNPF